MTIHHLWQGASANELTVALYAIVWKIFTTHHLWRGASANELTLATYAIVRNFHYPPPLAECFIK
ncbi:MAG: hypothetical protein F6K22_36945 [Okeania sp. SIO2F4]|uniref:hypothetical protein n=1 Tax=Okeania sp. SIO2F4 TaxID=2607790 RepID=UPI00142953D6|nr:hypothetical protein [Okeania sp. SIO2F4]NES07889.1 hypothetical protein [Okeania sp. SIO2F4]